MKKSFNSNVVLIGLPKSGKTTLGKLLAKQLKVPWTDTDQNIMTLYQHLTDHSFHRRKIYLQEGNEKFRSLEQLVIRGLKQKVGVISLGAGVLNTKTNLKYVKKLGKLIYLNTSPDIIWERIRLHQIPPYLNLFKVDFKKSPNLKQHFLQLLDQRTPIYEKSADITIVTDHLNPKQIISLINKKLFDE